MASSWIKIESVTPEKIEVFRIAKILGADRDLVLGKLVKLWIWADQHTTDGTLAGIDAGDMDAILGFPGFADALREVGWLKSGDGGVCIVNFQKQNGQSAKSRALDNRRKGKANAKQNAGAAIPSPNGTAVKKPAKAKPKKKADPERAAQIDALYQLYPLKKARPEALRAIDKALDKADFDAIKAGLERYIRELSRPDPPRAAYPATWFNQERWTDEETPVMGGLSPDDLDDTPLEF